MVVVVNCSARFVLDPVGFCSRRGYFNYDPAARFCYHVGDWYCEVNVFHSRPKNTICAGLPRTAEGCLMR